jgi:hypothetical protein
LRNAGVALMQKMGLFFMRKGRGNARFQRGLLIVILQQIAQVYAPVAKQA